MSLSVKVLASLAVILPPTAPNALQGQSSTLTYTVGAA